MKQKSNVIPALAILLTGLLVMAKGVIPPVTTALDQRRTLRTQVQALEADVANLPVEQQRQTKLLAELEEFKASLPDDEQLPKVLDTLNEAARLIGVRTPNVARAVRTSEVPGVLAVDLELKVDGTYAKTQALVQTIARLPRAYTARSITLTAADEPGTVGGALRLTTYKRDTQPPPAPPSEAPTPSAMPQGDSR